MGWIAHRKWKEAKQLPGTAGPGNMLGCCLIHFHFLWAIHPIRPVLATEKMDRALSRYNIKFGMIAFTLSHNTIHEAEKPKGAIEKQ